MSSTNMNHRLETVWYCGHCSGGPYIQEIHLHCIENDCRRERDVYSGTRTFLATENEPKWRTASGGTLTTAGSTRTTVGSTLTTAGSTLTTAGSAQITGEITRAAGKQKVSFAVPEEAEQSKQTEVKAEEVESPKTKNGKKAVVVKTAASSRPRRSSTKESYVELSDSPSPS